MDYAESDRDFEDRMTMLKSRVVKPRNATVHLVNHCYDSGGAVCLVISCNSAAAAHQHVRMSTEIDAVTCLFCLREEARLVDTKLRVQLADETKELLAPKVEVPF